MHFPSHSFCEFTFFMLELLLFSLISCTRSSPILFAHFFPLISYQFRNLPDYPFLTSWSPLYVPHYWANKLSFSLGYYFQHLQYLNLLSTRNRRTKITCTCLTNLHGAVHCASQWLLRGKEKSTLFHTYSSTSLHDRRQIRMQEFYFPFPNMYCSRCCVLWAIWV